eukprot:COSAG04_NODE_186_length_21024_cov_6.326069_4_plen_258_part_00
MVITEVEPVVLRAVATTAVALNTLLTIPTFVFITQQVLAGVWKLPDEEDFPCRRAVHVHGRRVALLALLLALALGVPGLPVIIVWVGSIASPFMVFVFPLCFHAVLRWREFQNGRYPRGKFWALLLCHTVVLVIGVGGEHPSLLVAHLQSSVRVLTGTTDGQARCSRLCRSQTQRAFATQLTKAVRRDLEWFQRMAICTEHPAKRVSAEPSASQAVLPLASQPPAPASHPPAANVRPAAASSGRRPLLAPSGPISTS